MSFGATHRIAGLYGMADHKASGGDPERLAAALLEGGCRIIQYRAKELAPDEIIRTGRAIRKRCAALGALMILNDHPDLVGDIDADGAHIGQTDGDLREARRVIGPHKILGISTHGPAEAIEAVEVGDYIAFGPVFATTNLSRPKAIQGPEGLRAVARAVNGRRPIVAIGGIEAHHLPLLKQCGADSWAVISAIALAPDPVVATRQFLDASA